MKRETFEKARDILDDINSLKSIKAEYSDRNWIAFCGAVGKIQSISSSTLKDDLKKFIDVELAKLEEELEKL